jgi:hypothetical protein
MRSKKTERKRSNKMVDCAPIRMVGKMAGRAVKANEKGKSDGCGDIERKSRSGIADQKG